MRYLAALFRRWRSGSQSGGARRRPPTAQSLAAAAAQELRDPLGQMQRSLHALHEALPPPSREAALLAPRQLEALYANFARCELAVQRALQVGAMLLQESNDRPVDTSGLRSLSAAEVVQQAVAEHALDGPDTRDRLAVDLLEDFTFRGVESPCVFALSYLIGTALRHSGSAVSRVAIEVGAGQIRLRHEGPALAPELLAALFDPLRPADRSGSAGLGLAHCGRILGAFGAQLQCVAAAGGGTEFTILFPASSPQEREEERLAAVAQPRAALSGGRLLIVADDPARRSALRQKLGPLALTTELEEAAGGADALAKLSARRFDVVLLQLQMADPDGYTLAAAIRTQGAIHDEVRILGCTAEPPQLARAKAHRAGIDGVVAPSCGQVRLFGMLQQVLQRSAASRGTGRRLAGRRILVAIDSAFNRKAIAAHLRNAAATVIEVEHGETILEQLHVHAAIDAVIMDLHMPGMDGLATTRAIRGAREPWSNVPVVALTARSDEPAVAAATAAGMNGFLVKPVEAPLLYETLARLFTAGAVPPAPAVAPRAPAPEGLLNLQRLDSYRRLGMLDELLGDYLPEMARLVRNLQDAVEVSDVQGTIAALHSLLGMSGEAGAQALYQEVRKLYVPLLENGQWPRGGNWLPQLEALAARTEQALKAYCSEQARSSAG